jgi:hypothetical protein
VNDGDGNHGKFSRDRMRKFADVLLLPANVASWRRSTISFGCTLACDGITSWIMRMEG